MTIEVEDTAPVAVPEVAAATVAIAAAVTPPVAAIPAVAPVPVVTAPVAPEAITYDVTGDAGLDVALAFVGRLGIAADHPAMLATADGDFSLIRAHLATFGAAATGWEQMVVLAEQALERSTAAKAAASAKVDAMVISVAGTAENWSAVQAWAATNASAEEKAEMNEMFDAGGLQARALASLLCSQYKDKSGAVIKPASATRDPSAGASVPVAGPLTNKQYGEAVKALRSELGSGFEQSPQYAALVARLPKK